MSQEEVIEVIINNLPWLLEFFKFANKYKIEFYGISFFIMAISTYAFWYLLFDILRDIRNIIKNRKK